MHATTHINGQVIPLALNDVDTDLIIPAQYLTSISKAGYGNHLFMRLRQTEPNFVFNRPEFAQATILVTQENFGCGSSREHAVWALKEAGIQAVIASSFADIFSSNSAKNGLLLINLSTAIVQKMLIQAATADYQLQIDIANQQIKSNKEEVFSFAMDPFRQHCLLKGLDDLDYLLSYQSLINAYFQRSSAVK